MKDDDFWNKVKADQVITSMQDTAQKKAELESVTKVLRQKYLNGKMQAIVVQATPILNKVRFHLRNPPIKKYKKITFI